MIVNLYTDGACSKNSGTGGWTAILVVHTTNGDKTKELSGYVPDTTNNRMELTAVIEGLKAIKKDKPIKVNIISDSSYVVDTFNKN